MQVLAKVQLPAKVQALATVAKPKRFKITISFECDRFLGDPELDSFGYVLVTGRRVCPVTRLSRNAENSERQDFLEDRTMNQKKSRTLDDYGETIEGSPFSLYSLPIQALSSQTRASRSRD